MAARRKIAVSLFACILGSGCATQLNPAQELSSSHVDYRPVSEITKFPTPPITFKRPGLVNETQRRQVVAEVIYPVIRHAKRPIAAVVVEFRQDMPDGAIVEFIWSNGQYHGSVVERMTDGHYDPEEYRRFLRSDEGGYPEIH